MADSTGYSQFEPPFGTVQQGSPDMEQLERSTDQPYAVIRRYAGLDPHAIDEITRQVNEGLVPIISQIPGFIAYFALHTGGDVVASITVFDNRAGADESTRSAASWVKEHLAALVPHPPQFTAGTVIAARVKEGARPTD